MTAAIGQIGSESEDDKSGLMEQLRAMSKAMRDEDGLLNHAQAALFLEVSARRVAELVELGKLTRFEFLGRTYVSAKEILARRDADVKAGRPKRGVGKRIAIAVKVVGAMDLAQAFQGGPFPAEEKGKKAKAGKKAHYFPKGK